MAITSKQAKKLLDKNIQNLKKQLDNGKVLTAAQMEILNSAAASAESADIPASSTKHAKTKTELAEIIGVDRKTVQRWAKLDGAPNNLSVSAWVGFIKAHGLKETSGVGPEKSAVQVQQLLLQNEKLRFQLGIFKKQYVPAADVEKWGAELGMEIRKTIIAIPKISASLAGLTPAEIEIRLNEVVDEVLGKLHLMDQHTAEMKETTKEAAHEA
ncbi:MAG: hypothetical protein KGL39_27130 [Patescibacteria group bacterium]|nr:hypothetical protein [Patescibacteria group bacterium]